MINFNKKFNSKVLSLIILWSILFVNLGAKAQGPCQNIIAYFVSSSPTASPVDSIIRICKGETVSFVGSATFETSSVGANYQWKFNNGATVVNGLTSSHTFNDEGVYVVDFVVTDANGCVNKNCDSRRIIHVSTTPHFDQSVIPDTVCVNKLSYLNGVVTPIIGEYNCAPPVAEVTFLPDGSGVSYTTSIDVTCFTPCDTVASATDINSICMNIEHSYLGDLDAKIICPNGQEANLFYTFQSGATNQFLGMPNDPGPGNDIPGTGFTYCFTMDAVWGPFINTYNNNTMAVTGAGPNPTTGQSMIAGDYQPQQSYNSLIGCPLNGTWTIQITDHIGSDNGYIFFWDISFRKNTDGYSFLPTYPVQTWETHPDIISLSGATAGIFPTTGGYKTYKFKVQDNINNCPYDTTFTLYVVDPGNPGLDTSILICLDHTPIQAIEYLAGTPEFGGVWTGTGVTPNGVFSPAQAGPGYHTLTYKQSKWNCDTSSILTVQVVNKVNMDFEYTLMPNCSHDTVQFHNLSDPGTYWWNFGDGTYPLDTATNPRHIYNQQAAYQVTLVARDTNGCRDTLSKVIDTRHPLVAQFSASIDSVCQTSGTVVDFTNTSIGASTWAWDFGDGATSNLKEPSHVFTDYGNKQVRLVVGDDIPCYDTSYTTIYVDTMPNIAWQLDKDQICIGDKITIQSDYIFTAQELHWNMGDGTYLNEVSPVISHAYDEGGKKYVTVTADFPVCESLTLTDSVMVYTYPVVDLGPDSVMCLNGASIALADTRNMNNPNISWKWNTGETTASITVREIGTYIVTATENDCASQEQVIVNKDCYTDIPNAFSPNGDGENDYFYPRQLLSKGVVGFTMQIFNRWGQLMFETSNTNGRGWDGRFNDQDQPSGVYVYTIKAVLKNGTIENYTGNVTLIR
jgi:gliding motility-associated-like protein